MYLPTKNTVFFESDIPSGSHAPMLDRKGRPAAPGAGAVILDGGRRGNVFLGLVRLVLVQISHD